MECKYNELLIKIQSLAFKGHEGVKRKISGEAYIMHPFRIASICSNISIIHEIIAWGHDLFEDTDLTFEDAKEHGFPQEIIDAWDALTRRKNETYFDFIMRCKLNPLAIQIKIFDINDNMRDLNEGSLKDKYRFAKKILEDWNNV